MPGAATLVVRAAQRAGAGLVTLGVFAQPVARGVQVASPETIFLDLTGGGELASIRGHRHDARVCGPGLGVADATSSLVAGLLADQMSGGKANLHQGAVGAGIDLATGMTLEGVLDDELVAEHPDTESPISGLQIPDWETMLALAAQCSDVTGLGYLGIDIVLDRDLGPLILELNARPGLNIQIANQRGLIPRLNTVADNTQDALSIDQRVRFARERFAHHHASND